MRILYNNNAYNILLYYIYLYDNIRHLHNQWPAAWLRTNTTAATVYINAFPISRPHAHQRCRSDRRAHYRRGGFFLREGHPRTA